MIIDSSAVLAVIGKEPGYERITDELAGAQEAWIGAPTRLEAGMVLTARLGPRGKTVLARFLQENAIRTIAFDAEHAAAALESSARAEGGRRPPGRNFGGVCKYEVASRPAEPLLCVGDDFPKTDLQLV